MILATIHSGPVAYAGLGYIGGNAPASNDPASPDGRAKKLNVPARVRINVLDRASLKVIASTLSASNGTWRIEYLSPAYDYLVIGQDDLGQVNAATQDWVRTAPMDP